jgi:predicted transposase/invertase (TIGR01784 family)
MMVQKGQYDNLVAIMDYVRVINSLENDATGNFLFTLFVYLSNMSNFEKESIIDITNQLSDEMKTKSKTFIDQFREEGIAIGIEKGIEKGSLQSRYEFARKLLLRNVPLEDICELTDLTLEEVKGIKA